MGSEITSEERRSPSLWVWFAALSALMGSMCMGAVLGWSSPAIPNMESDSKLHLKDEETKSWIGSAMTLGALFGGLLGGPASQMFGSKKTLIALGVPYAIGWILIGFANGVGLIITGRVVCGFAAGMCCGAAPTYCIQISTPNIRGLLGTGFQIFVTIGILYIDLFGYAGIAWNYLCIVGIVPAVVMSVGMIFMPESPSYLMNKFGRSSQVVNALRKLRQTDSDIETELKELEERAELSKQESGFSINQFKRADVYKPFIIAICLMFFQQFSGINAVLFYSADIFKKSGSSMDPLLSTCIVSAAMVIATISGGLIIDKLGRKILLLVSGAGHLISLGVMGGYYYSKRNDSKPTTTEPSVATSVASLATTIASDLTSDLTSSTTAPSAGDTSLGWLPVVCLVVFVIMFSIGYGPIPWMIVAEITPGFAIGFVSAIATAINWMCAFIVTKEFEAIQESLTDYGTFWMFAGICAASIVFVFLFVPETKGKSVEQMQKIFLGTNDFEDNSVNMDNKYRVNKDVSTV